MIIKLREIIEKKGISVYRLAKEIGMAPNNMTKIVDGETESIKFEIIEKICLYLDITPNDIFEVETKEYKNKTKYEYELSKLSIQYNVDKDLLEAITDIFIDSEANEFNANLINNLPKIFNNIKVILTDDDIQINGIINSSYNSLKINTWTMLKLMPLIYTKLRLKEIEMEK